jgi:DNA-binding transcriptional LysR family regulator
VTVYQLDQIRSFLAVVEALSFTRASAALGVGQSTVSQHVRKLEEQVGRQLFVRDTRSVTLTADGEALAGFGRTLLAVHDDAVAHFADGPLGGRLRVGVTDDLALTSLPRILRRFRQEYPRVDIELVVAHQETVRRRIESGHLDLALVKYPPGAELGRLVLRDRMVWVGARGTRLEPGRPVPLIVYQAPSISRSLAVETLSASGISYRVSCTVRGVTGVIAASMAGLGIAILASTAVPGELEDLTSTIGLPTLGPIDIVLLTRQEGRSAAADALAEAILNGGAFAGADVSRRGPGATRPAGSPPGPTHRPRAR